MNKKDYLVIVGILLGTLSIAFLINWLLSIDGFIPSAFSKNEWFGFWTTYSTGVFALIVGYLAISFGNKNSERALQQQNLLLIRQYSDKIKEEIAGEIKAHNRLFNVFDHSVTFVAMDHNNIPGMNERVIKDRAALKERCIDWSFMKQMYLSSPYLNDIVDEYDKCWNESVEVLDNYLRLQIDLLSKVQECDRTLRMKGIYDELYRLHTQQLESPNRNDYDTLKSEMEEAYKGREQQKSILATCNKEIEELVSQLRKLLNGVVDAQNSLATASVCFLSKLSGYAFLNSDDALKIQKNIKEMNQCV